MCVSECECECVCVSYLCQGHVAQESPSFPTVASVNGKPLFSFDLVGEQNPVTHIC